MPLVRLEPRLSEVFSSSGPHRWGPTGLAPAGGVESLWFGAVGRTLRAFPLRQVDITVIAHPQHPFCKVQKVFIPLCALHLGRQEGCEKQLLEVRKRPFRTRSPSCSLPNIRTAERAEAAVRGVWLSSEGGVVSSRGRGPLRSSCSSSFVMRRNQRGWFKCSFLRSGRVRIAIPPYSLYLVL